MKQKKEMVSRRKLQRGCYKFGETDLAWRITEMLSSEDEFLAAEITKKVVQMALEDIEERISWRNALMMIYNASNFMRVVVVRMPTNYLAFVQGSNFNSNCCCGYSFIL